MSNLLNARVHTVRQALYGFDVNSANGVTDLYNLAKQLNRIADDAALTAAANVGEDDIEGTPV